MKRNLILLLIGCVFAAFIGTARAEGEALDPPAAEQLDAGDAMGLLEMCARLAERVLEAVGDVITHPNVMWSTFLVLVGAALSVFIVEFLKRFSPLFPQVFDGQHWVLKIRLLSALIGGLISGYLIAHVIDAKPEDARAFALVGFIAAAAASPTLYDLAYRLAPGVTDRILKRVRGEA